MDIKQQLNQLENENKKLRVMLVQEQQIRRRLELRLREANRKTKGLETEKQTLDRLVKDLTRKLTHEKNKWNV